jgi:hypothetical protein
MFEFYNTVTVTIEVYIQTHCHDHHIVSILIRWEGMVHQWDYLCNMHGHHVTFVRVEQETFHVTPTLFTGTYMLAVGSSLKIFF